MAESFDTSNRPTEKPGFQFGCATHIFPVEEFQALVERGSWMEALTTGRIPPTTDDHLHFLQVDREEAEPQSLDERAWLRLKGRREFERESKSEPPATEDYGIIEWDKEKCWW